MNPTDHVPPDVPLFSVCPGCSNPNYSGLNWCSACGYLLIGFNPSNLQRGAASWQGHVLGSESHYVAPQFNGITNYAAGSNDQLNNQPTYLSSNFTAGSANAHFPPLDSSLFQKSEQFQGTPIQHFLPNYPGINELGFAYAGSYQSRSGSTDPHRFRQRCISGPSGLYNQNQHPGFLSNMQCTNVFLSDSDLAGFVYMEPLSSVKKDETAFMTGQFSSAFSSDPQQLAQLCNTFGACSAVSFHMWITSFFQFVPINKINCFCSMSL